MLRIALRAFVMAAALAAISPFASAYYFWVYFASDSSPFTPVPVAFDLNPSDPYGLPNNTVTYLISQQGPSVLMPGDTFPSIINEIHAAADVWNGVSTSSLKLAFGGLSPMTSPEVTPGIDVVFSDDLPPGLLAYTVASTTQYIHGYLSNGATSLPMIRPQLQLRSDLTLYQQSSYSDSFFLTIVHEFGHAIGLQHTLTSSVMSTQVTSAVTKAAPLAPDDVTGVSLLYPANGFPSGLGSVTGTVTLGGNGINLASVVVLSTNGTALSAFTNPDGTFQVQGIPPGQYYVYAHPLPPAAEGQSGPDGIFPPQDGSGNSFAAFTQFGTQFFGGTTNWTQATQINVTAGNVTGGVNFNMQSRPGGPAVSGMSTYGYPNPNNVPVGEPPLQNPSWLQFKANGVVVNGNQVAPGLSLSVIGAAAQLLPSTLAYNGTVVNQDGTTSPFLIIYMEPNAVSVTTPVAIAATLNNDVYVLPVAFYVVPSPAPSISTIQGSTDAQGNTALNIAGANLGPSTRILFDSIPAISTTANPDGSLTVTAPPASAGYSASVEALSADSQTSWQTLSGAPPKFTYAGPAYPSIGVTSPQAATVAAGTDTMVQITGYNTNFVAGQMAVGFGSSDITVERVWVVSPSQLLVNIAVNPGAAAQSTTVSVVSGLQLSTLSTAFQVTAATPGQPSVLVPILNQATNLEGVPAGGVAVMNTVGLPSNLTGWALTISNQQTTFTVNATGQILANVPAGATTGPAIVQLIPTSGPPIPPVVMQIDLPPPVILAAANAAGVPVSATSPVTGGNTVSLNITGLQDQTGALPSPSNVQIMLAGTTTTGIAVTATGVNQSVLQFAIPSNLPPGPQTVTVQIGTRISASFPINLY
jgi:hypothetical protein